MDTVTQTRSDLPADMPLIGFAGSPFTLASYMIEGGSSRNYAFAKSLMYSDSGAWAQLMEHLSSSISIYLNGQIEAGAQCVQLFDSWAGCLNFEDYRTYALPYVKKIIASLLDQAAGRPGHIFNLGHGILPQTPVDNAIALVDAVHELSQR